MLWKFLEVHLISTFGKGFYAVADIYVLRFNEREIKLDSG